MAKLLTNWIDKRIKDLGDNWRRSYYFEYGDKASELEENVDILCEEYKLKYSNDVESYIEKAYPGFLVVYCDDDTNKEEIITEIEKKASTIERKVSRACNREIDDDFEGYWFVGLNTYKIIDNAIYFDVNAYCYVGCGSGDVTQIFLDLNELLAREFNKVLKKYKNIKYAGQICSHAQDNYFNSYSYTSLTNMYQIIHQCRNCRKDTDNSEIVCKSKEGEIYFCSQDCLAKFVMDKAYAYTPFDDRETIDKAKEEHKNCTTLDDYIAFSDKYTKLKLKLVKSRKLFN